MIRNELVPWQKLNVTASWPADWWATRPSCRARPTAYRPLVRQPILIFAASGADLAPTDGLDRVVSPSALRRDVDKISKNLDLHP